MISASPTLAQPTDEHIRVHHTWARLATNEQLTAAIRDAEWLLHSEDDDGYPADVRDNSRLNQLAAIAAAKRELAYRSERGLSRPPLRFGIPREMLDDLKDRVRVEDEIGLTISLRRYGSILKGRCPFHDDRNPSLIVWSASNRWRCFGCNAGGDVFTWVQALMPTDFRGAVDYLSARAGVTLPRPPRPPRSRETRSERFEYRAGRIVVS